MKDTYLENDATGLAALVASGEVTPDVLLVCALDRVRTINPALNAVVMLQEDVARNAIRAGLPDGPFTGVPFLLKDLGAEAIDFPTNNGSVLMRDSRHRYDSALYLRLRAAGLVSFGRTASPELGIGPVTEAQVYGGPTRNPWNTDYTSGGSSGGAGAAVAAGIVPVAHGSDGGGSVRIPAASCGLVGFKPTRARLPEGPGAGEGWGGMAIDGFLTRSLRDTAALLDAVNGPDLGAPYFPPPMQGNFVQALAAPTGKLRVALCPMTLSGTPVHPDCVAAVEAAGHLLESLGHHVGPVQLPPDLDVEAMMIAWTRIVACGTALSVRTVLNGRPLNPALLDGVTRGAVAYAEQISGADYLHAIGEIHAFGRRMAHFLAQCDVLVTPTLAAPPAPVGQLKPDNEDFLAYRTGPGGVFEYSPFTAAFNASGQPAVSLPLHWNDNDLPIGVHLAMPFGADEALMSLSAQIEAAAPWWGKQQELVARLP
ncbi:amidase [Sedimentitalea todarodis]|uniref:Amidase family protein n=1 Tax=Sedimentitalea todarodis TaxID=1631240 RepID=A0ABU3VBL4_9RHOB|nr:amidase family protein [Sedimentitalea todarodis]MDU9003549.1 amidase family protein [Sedimentitalea todarodis]